MDSSFTQKEAHGLFKPSVTVILLETGKQKEVFMDILCISAEYQSTFFPPRRILYLVQNSVSPSVGRNLVNIHSFLRFVVVSYSLFLLDCCDI